MRHWTLLQSALFAGVILVLAAAAVLRLDSVHIPASAELLDGRMAKAFERHYDEVFPTRTLGTNVWAAIEYLAFGEGRPGLVVGKRDWLFTSEEFQAYPDAAAATAAHLRLARWVQQQLAQKDVRLVVALVPAKARVYPEYLDRRRPAQLHGPLYAEALASLRRAGIPVADVHAEFMRCKQEHLVFMRTDTHWSPAGARCAAAAVAGTVADARLQGKARQSFRTYVEGIDPYRGDLVRYLPLDPHFAALLPAEEPLERVYTAPLVASEDALLAEQPVPEVALVGTSYSADARWNFTGALQERLREDVVNFAAQGRGPFLPMMEFLDSGALEESRPRLVIWEIPERYLPMADDLRDALMPAAVRPTEGLAAPRHNPAVEAARP